MSPIEMATLIYSNRAEIVTIAAYVVSGAAAIAAITPSTKDDAIFSRLLSIVDVLALNVGGAKSKESAGAEPGEKFKTVRDAAALIRHAVKGR